MHSMNKNNKLLFWGELPPENMHGVSISNRVNLNFLSKNFQIDIIQEENIFHHRGKFSVFKITTFLKSYIIIFEKAFKTRYKYFYLVFSLSTFGGIKTLLAIASFRLLNRGKVVLHIHRGDFFSRFYKGIINKIISKIIFSLAQKVIVLSEITKKEIELVFNKKCYVLYNTVEIEYKSDHKKKQNIKFVYISNYLIDKGILDLLEVFKKLRNQYPEITLVTYGEFSDQHLKQLILSYGSLSIQINDMISGIEKFKIISQADCLILPSWNEGQPIVLLEAMSVGTAVLATKVGLIPDLLGSMYPFLSDPKDQRSLERIIIQFIKSKSINDISKELEEKYNNTYSQRKHSESLFQIFN